MNRSGIMKAVIVTVLGVLVVIACSRVKINVPADVMALHREAIVCDLHADTPAMMAFMGYDMSKRHSTVDWGPAGFMPIFSDIDIPRLREGEIDLFTAAICPIPKNFGLPGSVFFVREALNAIHRAAENNKNTLAIASSAEEAREIIQSGKRAILIGLEGGHGINGKMENLEKFYDRGVRYMTLTHVKNISWASSSTDDGEVDFDGLSDFGVKVVKRMEQMGMMIDLAHVSEETFRKTLEVTDCPVIVTHAGARALADHPRNLTDEQIKAIDRRGGVIGVIFHAGYLDPSGEKPLDAGLVVDHMDHIKKVAGVDVIALGSDYDGGVDIPPQLGHAGRLPNLTAELVRRGYTENEIKKILGENFLRAWSKIEDFKR